MIKKYKTALISLGLAFVFAGCSTDFMEDMKSYDSFEERDVYKQYTLAQRAIDELASRHWPTSGQVPVITRSGENLGDGFFKCSDETAGNYPDWINLSKARIAANDSSDIFGRPRVKTAGWFRVRVTNAMIDGVTAGGEDMTPDEKKFILGQAYFWRAWQYFEVARLYGGIPLVKHPGTVKWGDDSNQIPRSSTRETIDQICADLDSAILLLPEKVWSTNWGRPHSGAAAALKGRVLLEFASPVWNRQDKADPWQKAYDANKEAETILKTNGYGLYGLDNPGKRGAAWAKMFQIDNNTFNPEAILINLFSTNSSNDSKNNGWEKAIRPNQTNGLSGGSGYNTPVQMVDAFPMADGSRPVPTVNYDTLKFFKDRDPRFYRTFAFVGSFWPWKENTTQATIWNYNWWDNEASAKANVINSDNLPQGRNDWSINNSSVYVRKMSWDKAVEAAKLGNSGADFMEYRYAELVLNIAECAAALNKTQEAYEYLKMIRKRAGLPAGNDGLYGLKANMSRPELLEAVLYERRIELAYEGKRFYDLRRWMLYDGGTKFDAIPDKKANWNYAHGSTCTYLGLEPLNGTRRDGMYLLVKNVKPEGYQPGDDMPWTASGTANDPLATRGYVPAFDGATIDPAVGRVDPDIEDDALWNKGIETLGEFYDKYLYRNRYMEKDGKLTDSPVMRIDWKYNCYFFGLRKNCLEYDYEWLAQNIGWEHVIGGMKGTFDPLEGLYP